MPDDPEEPPTPVRATSAPYSEEALDKKVSSILNSIIADGMTKLEQARAVFKYVNGHIRFVGNTDKSDWQKGAYEGLTMGRGDCFTYYAASRALLTALDIDNMEVRRSGGTSDHWWNLVNCGDGWYHFDSCPRNVRMDGFDGFMFTDEVAAAYSSLRNDIPSFYSFDASLYPARAGSSDAPETPEASVPPEDEPSTPPADQPPEGIVPPAEPPEGIEGDPSSGSEVEPPEADPAVESQSPGEPAPEESLPSGEDDNEEAPFIPPFNPFPDETEPSPEDT